MSSLRCKVICIIINFLVFWSACLSFSLVHFKNGPKYFMQGDCPGVYPFDEIYIGIIIIIIVIYSLEFFTLVFHWNSSDSKSPQVSRTLLSILAVLNNAVVWMVSTHRPTSKSSSSFNNPLVTVPKALIKIGIIVTFMFHSFFCLLLLL